MGSKFYSSKVNTYEHRDNATGIVTRGYELLSKRLRWVNAAYFIDSTQPRTRINAFLPPNFTNSNTSAFAVIKDQRIVVRLNPELSNRTFFAVNIPLNKSITIVAISKIGEDLYWSAKEVTTTPNITLSLQPEKKTKQQIVQLLDALN